MPPLLQAIILGIVQGLTELLPVSSSAHLMLLPSLFGWQSLGLPFDVALHTGTTLAILAYFAAETSGRSANLFCTVPGDRRMTACAGSAAPSY
jgi:undecaprenyl pyrophosphate phosphatase UppP